LSLFRGLFDHVHLGLMGSTKFTLIFLAHVSKS